MTPFDIVLLVVVAIGIGASVLLQLRRPTTAIDDSKGIEKEIGRLQKEIETTKDKLSKNEGAGKQMFIELQQVKAKLESTEKERDALRSSLTKFETKREQQEKEHMRSLEKIESAERALKEERQRVLDDEQDRRRMAEEERDRLWNEHEVDVVSILTDLCKQPHLKFTTYTNNKLPDGFDGSLKPDFLIDFLGQYVVFDAKVSKAQSLQGYIDQQVKKTAEKMKKNNMIYPHIFLVVPTEAIGELKKLIYPQDHFYFYIISRESLAPILAMLKRITEYENFEQMEPQKRENVINFMAEMTAQIHMTGATSLLTTKRGVEILTRIRQSDPELAAEVEKKTKEKTLVSYSQTEIKRLASSLTAQNSEITSLAAPKAPLSKKTIETAESILAQKLL